MRAMRPTLLWLCLLCLLRAQPSRDTEYLEFPPTSKLERIVLRGSRRIVGDRAVFRLELPRVTFEGATGGPITGRVEVANADRSVVRAAEVPLELSDNAVPLRVVAPEIEVDLSGVPDGDYTARFVFPDLYPNPPGAGEPWDIRKIDAALESVAPDHRGEIAVWIEEANRPHLIWGKLPLWPNLDNALSQPEDPYAGLRGFLIRAYENPDLRRRQPYTVYVPESLDLSEPAPLMILLHGSGGDYRNLVADFAAGQEFETHPMLIANAGAFLNTEFRHMPMNDVRGILEDMRRKYNVDPDRIYAQGISLGGRGVLDLAARMPDTFAAVSAQGTYGVHHELMDPHFAVRTDPVAYRLAAKNDIRTWLPNLLNTPVEMVFGWRDASTRPAGALAVAIVLQRLGGTVVERGFDQGHNLTLPDYDWSSTREWFLSQTKNRLPTRIHFRVGNLRHNRHAWIRVDALHDYSGVGEVKARLRPDGTLDLETHNVARLSYLPPDPALPGADRFPAESATYHFHPDGGASVAPTLPMEGSVKSPARSGPMWNLFSDPLLVVLDTSGDPAEVEDLRRMARSLRGTDATPDWEFPLKEDYEVTEEERRTLNLVFLTTSDSDHPWRQEIATPLPDDARRQLEAGANRTLYALRPSPWADDRLALVVEANGAMVRSPYHLGIFQEPLQADWLILEGSRFVSGGVYAHDWTPGAWTDTSFFTRVITR